MLPLLRRGSHDIPGNNVSNAQKAHDQIIRKGVTRREVVIVSACRSAIGAFGGTLRDLNAAVIGSVTMKEAIDRAGIEAEPPGMAR